MAVDLMLTPFTDTTFSSIMEENALKEATTAGLQSVEKLIHLLSQNPNFEYKAVADVAVNKFKKVISLLDRSRTGHARFRRGPLPKPEPEPVQAQTSKLLLDGKPSNGSAFRRVIQRLPPLPTGLVKPAPVERKESSTTINFSTSQQVVSAATSYISTLTGDTDSVNPSMSSGFQITNMSQVSSVGKPPLSSNSIKRKCGSMDESKCGASSGRCHCSKRRKSRLKRVVRVPAVSVKMADIPPDDYSWRKYGQKPIKGSPHPRFVNSIPLV